MSTEKNLMKESLEGDKASYATITTHLSVPLPSTLSVPTTTRLTLPPSGTTTPSTTTTTTTTSHAAPNTVITILNKLKLDERDDETRFIADNLSLAKLLKSYSTQISTFLLEGMEIAHAYSPTAQHPYFAMSRKGYEKLQERFTLTNSKYVVSRAIQEAEFLAPYPPFNTDIDDHKDGEDERADDRYSNYSEIK